MNIQTFANHPINFNYRSPTQDEIALLKTQDSVVTIESGFNILVENAYFKKGYIGTAQKTFAREAVSIRIKKMANALLPDYGVLIFDAFRTRATQEFLFYKMQEEIKNKHPHFSSQDLALETRKYVSHPEEPSRFAILPHNSGGAIDITLFDLHSSEKICFGSEIDQTDDISSTDYFEKDYPGHSHLTEKEWLLARKHRRILFHTMCYFGFTNYRTEWWHYDLGDCMWAQELNIPWIFDSMEHTVYTELV